MHDEPLGEWARRREERRNASKGKLRAIPLTEGSRCGQHVEPAAPRVIQEWNGSEWVAMGVVEDLAAVQAIRYPVQPVEEKPAQWDRPGLAKGRGRHRKPTTVEERDK